MNRVAVSILNYKSAQSTIACIQSLQAAAKFAGEACHLEIFILDNDSGAEDQQQLNLALKETPTVHLRVNDKNLGFSAGHNRNLDAIFSGFNADYIWLLNNDCLVSKSALRVLVECAQSRPDVGIWGATLLESDGQTIQCAGGCFYNTWVSSFSQYGHGKHVAQVDQLKSAEYDYIAGASLFFPVATLENGLRPPIGSEPANAITNQNKWLNESFFLYFEELDLAKRLKTGIGMAWCQSAMIRHAGGSSTGTIDNQRTEIAEYYSTLSALKFTRLYYPRRMWVMAPARFMLKSILLLMRGDIRLLGPLTRAYFDFYRECKSLATVE